MTESNQTKYCQVCRNQGTRICKACTYRVSPSGKESEPSLWAPLGELQQAAEFTKPPLGVKPKYIHDEERAEDISEAIVRYLNARLPLPYEWIREYNGLRKKPKKK